MKGYFRRIKAVRPDLLTMCGECQLLAYCRIAGIDFDSWDFQRDVYKALHHLARSEKRRRRIERDKVVGKE